jgi:outer membrane cobalamin receptor
MLGNLGELVVRGVDASAKARIVERVEVGGAYNFADAHSDDICGDMPDCEPLDRLPHHKAEWWTRVAPIDRATAMVRGRYVGRAIDLGMRTPAYVVWEVTATAQLGGDWLAVARCDDLLDVKPETRYGYHAAGRVISLAIQGTWD